MNSETVSICGVPETMLQTMYVRAVYSQKPDHKFYDGKAIEIAQDFSVQDATALPYAPESFDAVVISNALHIMPHPEKALSEIRRVLKLEGLLFAPTFVHGESTGFHLRVKLMELAGFHTYHKYTLVAYDESGNAKDITFETRKVLTDDAYPCLKVVPIRGVVTWAEIQFDELPSSVQEKYKG